MRTRKRTQARYDIAGIEVRKQSPVFHGVCIVIVNRLNYYYHYIAIIITIIIIISISLFFNRETSQEANRNVVIPIRDLRS